MPSDLAIAVVVNAFPATSETFIFNKVVGLQEAGLDVTVIAGRRDEDRALYRAQLAGHRFRVVDRLQRGGVVRNGRFLLSNVVRRPLSAGRYLLKSVRRFGLTKRALKNWLLLLPFVQNAYDIIHFELSGLAVIHEEILPLLAPRQIFVSCRGTAEQVVPLVDGARAGALTRLWPRVARAHCVSEDMVRTVERYGLPPEKAFVNRPAIDTAFFRRRVPYPASDGEFRIVTTGRLHWDKGYVYALLAVRRLVEEGYPVSYHILGDGPDHDHLVYTVDQLELREQVCFKGACSREEVRAELEQAGLFVLPTVREGLSNACLEAMAMEVPVVSTTTGGMPEAITDGVDGLLVAPRDPQALAEKIKVLYHDSDLRNAMGRKARTKVEQAFTLDRQIRVFVEEYRAALEAHRRARPERETPRAPAQPDKTDIPWPVSR